MINALLVAALPQSIDQRYCIRKMQDMTIATPSSHSNIQLTLSTHGHPFCAMILNYNFRLSRRQMQLERHALSVGDDT
jgi:hypothetical protein